MTTKNVLQPIDVNNTSMDRSPARKRARYEAQLVINRWELKKDETYDGIGVLDSDSDTLSDSGHAEPFLSPNTPDNVRNGSQSNITTPKQEFNGITYDEWDQFHTKKPAIQAGETDYFSLLSDEVVLHIFYFLPTRCLSYLSPVCSRFHRLTKDESLWARIDVAGKVLVPSALGQILSRQAVILRLAQCEIQSPIIEPDCRAAAESFQSRLLYVDMGMAHIDIPSLVIFFTKCQRLKKVSLEHVTVNADVMIALSKSTDLEVLNLAMVEGLDATGVTAILKRCRKLRELNIAWTYLDNICINLICGNLPSTIDRLNISGCRKLLNDANVSNLVRSCPSLRELDLSDCTAITGNCIPHIVQLKNLNFLALSRCYQIPATALYALKKNPQLVYLDLHGGYLEGAEIRRIQETLGAHVQLNKFKFSSVARPTVGGRRSSIWNLRVRD